MTQDEFKAIMKGLSAVYELKVDEAKIRFYWEIFKNIDTKLMQHACYTLVSRRKYNSFPLPGEIMEEIDRLIYANELTESDSWGVVEKLIHKYGHYNSVKALQEMDELTRKTVEQIGFYEICMTTDPEIVRAQFLRMYKLNQQRAHELAKMNPEFLKELQAKNLIKQLEGEK